MIGSYTSQQPCMNEQCSMCYNWECTDLWEIYLKCASKVDLRDEENNS